jgi:hypothetical protein
MYRPRGFGSGDTRRDRHQSSHRQPIVGSNRHEEIARIHGRDSRLLRLISDIDLEHDLNHPVRPMLFEQKLQPIRDFRTINGVNHIKNIERHSRLVSLEGSDEVPTRLPNAGFLGLRLLNSVLTQITGAGGHGLISDCGRVCL